MSQDAKATASLAGIQSAGLYQGTGAFKSRVPGHLRQGLLDKAGSEQVVWHSKQRCDKNQIRYYSRIITPNVTLGSSKI